MLRHNHYEAAFEAFLRTLRVPYVAVDESKRAVLSDGTLKSLDFIVSPAQGRSWLIDVKGRRFPSGVQKQYWKNWSTLDDLRSLGAWERLFGGQFGGLFVFAYNVLGERSPLPQESLFEYRGEKYGFVGVKLSDYAYHARPISQAWDTVAMPVVEFRRHALPLEQLLLVEHAGLPA